MKSKNYLLFVQLLLIVILTQGAGAVGVKAVMSRNNINEETVSTIQLCETTEEEIVKLFRAPTEDFMRKQGDYTIYIYKGFSSRAAVEKHTLELMINQDNIVVDKRLDYEGDELMADRCQ